MGLSQTWINYLGIPALTACLMTNHLDEMSHVPKKKPLLNYALITLLFWNQQFAQLDPVSLLQPPCITISYLTVKQKCWHRTSCATSAHLTCHGESSFRRTAQPGARSPFHHSAPRPMRKLVFSHGVRGLQFQQLLVVTLNIEKSSRYHPHFGVTTSENGWSTLNLWQSWDW